MTVHFNAYHYVESEKALELSNSKGKKTSRLHLDEYHGIEGKDPCAVAAKKLAVPPQDGLGLLDRQFYVLHAHQEENATTWYKINKRSLQKRVQPRMEEIKSKCVTLFDSRSEKFFEKLIVAKVPLTPFKHIAFCNKPDTSIFANSQLYLGGIGDLNPHNISHLTPGSILVVSLQSRDETITDYRAFLKAQPDDFRHHLLKNDILQFVLLPYYEDEDITLDPKTLEKLDVQGSLLRTLEEGCKNALFNDDLHPIKARIVLANGPNS